MMDTRTSRLRRLSLAMALGFLLLGGCGSDPEKPEDKAEAPPPEPTAKQIEATIAVAGTVNPDIDGRPSPIAVRIYELKTLGKFEVGDFYKLFDEYEAFLGADLIASEQFHLKPGDTKILKLKVPLETNYFAVTAAYRDLDRAIWRASKELEEKQATRLEVRLDTLSIDIK
jgi:type VI secretion system protein VasD